MADPLELAVSQSVVVSESKEFGGSFFRPQISASEFVTISESRLFEPFGVRVSESVSASDVAYVSMPFLATSGTVANVYKSPWKTAGEVRAKIRLDRTIAASNFVDEFSGSSLDTDLWSSWKPPNTAITVSGGTLTLSSTASTNGFPVVQSLPGKTFPVDTSIGWTLEWSMSFPVITGFGVFFRVCDLEHSAAIVAIKCNEADGLTVESPDGNRRESLGQDTGSHDYTLVYTPLSANTAAKYEITRDGKTVQTLDATDRQAWYIAIGNGAIQTNLGGWTNIRVSRVDVNLVSNEEQDYPDWTDRETVDGEVWGRLPWVNSFSMASHKRNTVDQAVLRLSQSGFVTGLEGDGGKGYRSNMFGGFVWANREVRIESRQSDGEHATDWREVFRGYCDEPQVTSQNGQAFLDITMREKVRGRLQRSHLVRGYSDSSTAIDGLQMNKTWTQIIEDVCSTVGLASTDYSVLSSSLKPRSYQVLGGSGLDAVSDLADQGVAAVYRNAGLVSPGMMHVAEWTWGNKQPHFYLNIDAEVVSLDWAETAFGMTAQVQETVQHSEFGEFSDIYPHAPVPPFGAVMRHNATIAQSAGDINSTRLLPFLRWRLANRELNSIVVRCIGQDWLEHDLQCQVFDRRLLNLGQNDYYIVDGWEYQWDPQQGWRTSIHLVTQDPEKVIMRAALDQTVQMSF